MSFLFFTAYIITVVFTEDFKYRGRVLLALFCLGVFFEVLGPSDGNFSDVTVFSPN